MKRDFSPETIDAVLSGQSWTSGGVVQPKRDTRTPLNITFELAKLTGDFAPAEHTNRITDRHIFNAVGSRVLSETRRGGSHSHLPVLDLDGGGAVQSVANGSKAILRTVPRHWAELENYTGKYGPASMLRDILGDNDIGLEVFDAPLTRHSTMLGTTEYKGKYVTALALRSQHRGVFDIVDSTQQGHNHLFIQQEFSEGDHRTLINELGRIGIISQRWVDLTNEAGMGIVRTPWTDKQGVHKDT